MAPETHWIRQINSSAKIKINTGPEKLEIKIGSITISFDAGGHHGQAARLVRVPLDTITTQRRGDHVIFWRMMPYNMVIRQMALVHTNQHYITLHQIPPSWPDHRLQAIPALPHYCCIKTASRRQPTITAQLPRLQSTATGIHTHTLQQAT